ncbi:eukaryotic translation initiation factor 5B-like [Olea europaea var. sylvestris]|uniref:Uncharacterized protein n=1 Tax=Olea europaea subsp. europaea TaxID=158383 RepID=A0A8S0V766_OLEEU|nr:eukaryotic translation initiation factor 5B-like [Olea europaea var. sylvestris]CAA3029275.1 Hypothetical predicted protein [Olea europaea subsp. europaea]
MSRCFPYPPPGYSLSRASNEALIESIKLQNEREKSNKERKKEKRREKEEKRKEREKKKEKTNQNSGKSHNVDNVRVEENIWVDSRGKLLQKGRKAEIEQLERSSLTEEHEQPLCSRIPSSSFESTENSNKRKRHTSSIDGSNSLGNIIKIRLPSKKKKEPDTSFDNPQLCSTSGRMDFPAQQKDEIALRASQGTVCPSSQGAHNLVQGFPTRTDQELIFSASRQMEVAAQGKLGTSSGANTVLTPMQRLELQYKDLVENWVPPELHALVNYPDDQEWLSQSKDNDVRSEKRFRSSGDAVPCSSSLSLWPQSRYLPDADIYALPFTVPF